MDGGGLQDTLGGQYTLGMTFHCLGSPVVYAPPPAGPGYRLITWRTLKPPAPAVLG